MADNLSIPEYTMPSSAGHSPQAEPHLGMTNLRNTMFRRGEVICREGTSGQTVFFLHTGKVKLVRKNKQGKNFLLGLLRPEDTIGLSAVLHSEAYTSTAIAIEAVNASYLDAESFLQWLAHCPDRLHQILQLLCTELERVENRMYAMTRATASARLAEILLMFDQTYGVTPGGSLSVRLKPREYADLINVARGSIYRLLKQFADTGLINLNGSTITLLDRMRLSKTAQL